MTDPESTLHRLISGTEEAFPDRMRGYYLHGSAADGTNVDTSDLDVDVVVKGHFTSAQERAGMERQVRELAAGCGPALDIDVIDEASLFAGAEPSFKLGSHLLYGEDIREHVPLVPLEAWGRERMYWGVFLMIHVFDRQRPVRIPVDYADPEDKFFGYARRPIRLPDGTAVPSTRDLLRVTGWLATALVAHEGKRYVARKRDAHKLCGETFRDGWASLLEQIYTTCRGESHSLIPQDPANQARLRRICAQALSFENHFLTRFKIFLLSELKRAARGEETRAPWLLGEIPFDDPGILRSLRDLAP